MDLIAFVIGGLGLLIGSILVHLIATDIYHNAPRVAQWLIRRAVRFLPEAARPRFQEEWLAHMDECVGAFSKLTHALGCVVCARNLRKTILRDDVFDGVFPNFAFRVATRTETLNFRTFRVLFACIRSMAKSGRLDAETGPQIAEELRGGGFYTPFDDLSHAEKDQVCQLLDAFRLVEHSYDWSLNAVLLRDGDSIYPVRT